MFTWINISSYKNKAFSSSSSTTLKEEMKRLGELSINYTVSREQFFWCGICRIICGIFQLLIPDNFTHQGSSTT